MKRTGFIAFIALALLPGLALSASPLSVECSTEQKLPGRALVCEYFMLGRQNAELAELHALTILAGKAGSKETKRWVAARDACKDVECLDRLFETGMREARLALVEADSRRPAMILTSARGVPLRIAERAPVKTAPLPPVVQSVQEPLAPERPSVGAYVTLALLGVAVAYAIMARRLTA